MIKLKTFLLIILLKNYAIIGQNICPRKCFCDLDPNNLNRAQCSKLNLINPLTDIPQNVEVFDLSQNLISTLENESFKGLSNIVQLILKFNSIHTIYLDAFYHLKLLKNLDLSYNRLESVDERILENNSQLKILNLAGNKFMSLDNKPILISNSLEDLSLRKSQLDHIHPKLFTKLNNLKRLDLSENFLITLRTDAFLNLKQLKTLNLTNNRWSCDENFVSFVKFLQHRNVTIELDACKFELRSDGRLKMIHMFERMIVAPQEVNNNNEKEAPKNNEVNVDNIWKNLETEFIAQCSAQNLSFICKEYEICVKNYPQCDNISKNNFNLSIYLFKLINNWMSTFFIGMAFGAAIVFSVTFPCINNKKHKKNNKRRNRIENEVQSLPPVPIRRRRISRSSRPQVSAISQSDYSNNSRTIVQSDFGTFLTRIFERPSRRNRYYRTLNQNTAHLIRRLSRSNLFSNRVTQHFANEMNVNQTDSNNSDNRLYTSNQEENVLLPNPIGLIESNQNQTNLLDEQLNNRRSETPPPSYQDIVVK